MGISIYSAKGNAIKPANFEVGDRVKTEKEGRVGEVTAFDGGPRWVAALVKFSDGKKFWILTNELEKVPHE